MNPNAEIWALLGALNAGTVNRRRGFEFYYSTNDGCWKCRFTDDVVTWHGIDP